MREFEPEVRERARHEEETKAAAMEALLTAIKARLPSGWAAVLILYGLR